MQLTIQWKVKQPQTITTWANSGDLPIETFHCWGQQWCFCPTTVHYVNTWKWTQSLRLCSGVSWVTPAVKASVAQHVSVFRDLWDRISLRFVPARSDNVPQWPFHSVRPFHSVLYVQALRGYSEPFSFLGCDVSIRFIELDRKGFMAIYNRVFCMMLQSRPIFPLNSNHHLVCHARKICDGCIQRIYNSHTLLQKYICHHTAPKTATFDVLIQFPKPLFLDHF